MIRLTIEGKEVPLPRDTKIKYRLVSNVFDFDKMESSLSLPFSLGNDRQTMLAFDHPDVPEMEGTPFRDYEAVLAMGSLELFSGLFRLDKIGAKYEGTFSSGASLLGKYKNTPLAEMVTGEADLGEVVADRPNNLPTWAKNPVMLFDNRYFTNSFEVDPPIRFYHFCLDLGYLIEQAFDYVGLDASGFWNAMPAEFSSLIISNFMRSMGLSSFRPPPGEDSTRIPTSTRSGQRQYTTPGRIQNRGQQQVAGYMVHPKKVVAKQLVPNQNFADFLHGLRKTFCLHLNIDAIGNTVKPQLLNDILDSSDFVDWTDKVLLETLSTTDNRYEGISFQFLNGEDLPEDEISVVDTLDDIPSGVQIPSPYHFVKEEGILFETTQDGFDNSSDPTRFRFLPSHYNKFGKVVDEGKQTVTADFNTIGKTLYGYLDNFELEIVSVSGNFQDGTPGQVGQIRWAEARVENTPFMLYEPLTDGVSVDVVIRNDEDQEYYIGELVSYDAANRRATTNVPFVSFQNTTYSIYFRYRFPARFPVTEFMFNEKLEGGLLFYWGEKPLAGTGRNYRYASPDNYDAQGNKLGNFSLSFYGPEGLYETFWKKTVSFMRDRKPVECLAMLNEKDIHEFKPFRKVLIRNNLYFVNYIDLDIRHSGMGLSKLHLWRIPTSL